MLSDTLLASASSPPNQGLQDWLLGYHDITINNDRISDSDPSGQTSPPPPNHPRTMDISPARPHRRRPSDIDVSYQSPSASYDQHSPSRRSSTVGYSPTTPRSSAHHDYSEFDNSALDASADDNGLGSLADELADAWDEDEADEADEGVSELLPAFEETRYGRKASTNGYKQQSAELPRDSGIADLTSSPTEGRGLLTPLSATSSRQGKNRFGSGGQSQYDGSEYGEDSDFDPAEDISAGLEARMAAIEGLARRGTESNGSEADGLVARVTESLRDLGSQAGIEGGATRLTTTNAALSTHLAHQTRLIASLTSTLLSPLAPPPPLETIDEILPLIALTLPSIPTPSPQPLLALHSLSNTSRELIHTLSYLADSLHMARQTSAAAGRRLRASKDAVSEWRREVEGRERGIRWIEDGGWDEKLRGREAAGVCRDVVGGFEEVCNGWRERLLRQAGEVGAG
ncbi:hypothetical protein K402DRAFT_345551 [Aulographum hederae CBS 113979]|uniref:Uncharacterized protein n=1 Tax=Aulographum hederae CBS 113979 TaxID=1176131 RepID=A0A6G1HFZ4_9PEZI|nr:hypothetical protein K402DRAFT_345551 [Aulographum hederae CBS 113979]